MHQGSGSAVDQPGASWVLGNNSTEPHLHPTNRFLITFTNVLKINFVFNGWENTKVAYVD